MNVSDIFLRAGRNLRESKARTILTALAIAVGATTITVAIAAGNGGRAYTDEIVQSSGDLYSLNVYAKPETEETVDDGLPEYEETPSQSETDSTSGRLSAKDIELIQKLDGVTSISPMLDIAAKYVTRGEGEKRYVAPLSVKADRTSLSLAAGSLEAHMPKAGQIVIPETFLKSLGFASAESAINKQITLNISQVSIEDQSKLASRDYTFTIAAVDRKSDTGFYYNEALRLSAEDGQQIYNYQNGVGKEARYYGLVVLANQGANIAMLQQTIEGQGYLVYSLEDQKEDLMQVINIAQWGLIGFGALAVIASVFGIINTQYISVLERTQQIGLMKAVGASRRDISRLFRYEAAWVGLLGGTIGVVIAYAVTLLNPVIAEILDLEAGTQLLRMDWVASIGLVVGLIAISVASGYFPSRKAAKLDPIEALRTE